VTTEDTDVVIVGSGPYALSLAAHLRARRVDFRIFGPPMRFWRAMPSGLNLKSLAFATNIYVPERGFSFPEWCRERGLEDHEPCTMRSFADYGMWMQGRFASDLDPQLVTRVGFASGGSRGFEVSLENGARLMSRRVVFATGLSGFSSSPPVLRDLPPERTSHTFDLTDYSIFRGQEVAVVGGGASAIEGGALVNEGGGTAQILVREGEAIFHTRTRRVRPLYERILEPMTVLGASRKHWVIQTFPLAVHFVPEARRVRFVQRYLGPSAPWWIKDRVVGIVPIHLRTEVVEAKPVGARVQLVVRSPGGTRTIEVDHVIAGTGFEVDLARLPYLDPQLRERIRVVQRAPDLSMNFESSVKGAYFMGPSSAMSFGPLFRFVAGAEFTVKMVARHLAGSRDRKRAYGEPRAWASG
jgi:thioredoxin reductase